MEFLTIAFILLMLLIMLHVMDGRSLWEALLFTMAEFGPTALGVIALLVLGAYFLSIIL